MDTWYTLYTFAEDLEIIEKFLFKLVAHNRELRFRGLGYVIRQHSSESETEDIIPRLDNFSTKLSLCIKVIPILDKTISDRLDSLLTDSKIEDLIAQLSTSMKIIKNEHHQPSYLNITMAMVDSLVALLSIFLRKPLTFPIDKSIALESVISSIVRLKALVKPLHEQHSLLTSRDDEIFKPSNVDINTVVRHIDMAIENLTISINIRTDEKERLVAYLQEAKTELSNDTPAWKKIIGALVICATLLSGSADAPQAVENLDKAIKYILGTSVERPLPQLLPEYKPYEAEGIQHHTRGLIDT